MLTKLLLLLFLAYLVNKVLILPFKKEWNNFFGNSTQKTEAKEEKRSDTDSLLKNQDIEDAEYKDLKD